MKAAEIRNEFLRFFEDKGHKIVPSAPIVVQNDPTLMFTNAGMNQFKDYFLGNKAAQEKRIADTQKCLRVSGKHNDLEEVGLDTYHHTMFEMLGNWSFGDYFKEEAIGWAWELLTQVYGLPQNRLYATVFEGDKKEGLEADEESRSLWHKFLPQERVLNGSKADNFWEMGDTGPCGPCSEIHIDLRPDSEIKESPGSGLVNKDHPLVIEIWNLVFIQFNRKKDGSLENLPDKHVDTGMGFERLAMVVQGKTSNYDTDVFQPIIEKVSQKAGINYGTAEKTDIAMRVIVDHLRAISFAIADGQLPGNVKAGYVIRRILRRAVRYGYTFLDFREPFLNELVSVLAAQFGNAFPELTSQEAFVIKVIKEEEASFLRTLENGLKKFEILKEGSNKNLIDGTSAFELYDTYGFPIDLTALIARENGFEVDMKGFEAEMKNQKNRSRQAAEQDTSDWTILANAEDESVFIGYEQIENESCVTRYREINQKGNTFYHVVLDQTPFYAESGGQVGDTGWLVQGEEKIDVLDTSKENDVIIHLTKKLPQDLSKPVVARIDSLRRELIQNNHSATHLMHAALRKVLGDHVQQRGSLVSDKVLRFDFSHFSKMTEAELAKVEAIVNARIRENIELNEQRNVPIERAKKMGAMALFGEKYGEFVRVITFNKDFSVELCGGTHVSATGQIGTFKIISEASIATGVRRIEAISASRADQFINEKLDSLKEISELLKQPKDIVKAVDGLLSERQELMKSLEEFRKEKAKKLKSEVMEKLQRTEEMNTLFFLGKFPDQDTIKQIAFDLKREVPNLVMLIAGDVNGSPSLTVMLSDDIVKDKELNASEIVREMARLIKGGGGGQAFYASAGGKDVTGLSAALEKGKTLVAEKLGMSV